MGAKSSSFDSNKGTQVHQGVSVNGFDKGVVVGNKMGLLLLIHSLRWVVLKAHLEAFFSTPHCGQDCEEALHNSLATTMKLLPLLSTCYMSGGVEIQYNTLAKADQLTQLIHGFD